MREKESGRERPTVAMETGSYQLTPCFPLTPHPPTPFPFPRSLPLHLLPLPPSVRTTPLSPFPSTPPPPPSGICRSIHRPHLCFLLPHPLLPRLLHFHPLHLRFALILFFPLLSQFLKLNLLQNPQKKRLRG